MVQSNLRGRQGVPQNEETAVKWFKRAAEQGHAKSQSNLGVMFYKGEGVIQDKSYARIWCLSI